MLNMKKTIYILAMALFGVLACTKEANISVDTSVLEDNVFPEGAEVTLTFSVPTEVPTKVMDEKPDITSMHVAVFTAAGTLKEYRKATLIAEGPEDNGIGYKKTYQVTVFLSSTERHLHFIANAPDELSVKTGGEAYVINNIITEGTNTAYWQRFVLEDGVTAEYFRGANDSHYDAATKKVTFTYINVEGIEQTDVYDVVTDDKGRLCYTPDDEIMVVEGSYIHSSGRKIVDGTGYTASKEVVDLLSNIPLIRNFLKLRVVEKDDSAEDDENKNNFHPISFALINVPASGRVAPYDVKNGFIAPYMNPDGGNLTKEYLYGTLGYVPTVPGSIDTSAPADADFVTVESKKFVFMYERPIPTADPTSLIVYGTLDGVGNRYFKIEINDEDGKYVPFYRNFEYVVELGVVKGSHGWTTAADAYKHSAIGDVSNSVETQTLSQISDGKGTTLWVNEIEYTNIGDKVKRALIYKMTYKDPSSSSSTVQDLTADVELTIGSSSNPAINVASGVTTLTGSRLEGNTYIPGYDKDGNPEEAIPTPDGQSGWYFVDVDLFGSENTGLKKSVVTVAGESGSGKEMSRKVTYRVMTVQDVTVSASPLTSQAAGQETTLTITLKEDLGFSLFPLVLKIEAEKNNLMPSGANASLPVDYGPSTFSNANGFYYLYTISYSEYYDAESEKYNTVKTLKFKTTGAGNPTNATKIHVVDQAGKYFNVGECELTVSSN